MVIMKDGKFYKNALPSDLERADKIGRRTAAKLRLSSQLMTHDYTGRFRLGTRLRSIAAFANRSHQLVFTN